MSLPADYYRSLAAVEDGHWWHRGMRSIAGALLRDRVRRGGELLDAGCGTGGFLAWAASLGFDPLAGIDPSPEAVDAARARLPGATIERASLRALPFSDSRFAVVACNDVLQHVHVDETRASLAELRRVVRDDGALVVRTNGGRQARRSDPDWRLFDRETLVRELGEAGFRVERCSFVNVVGSAAAALRGRSPRAPSGSAHGIPAPTRRPRRALSGLLRLEGELVSRGTTLPYGHTLVALAVPDGAAASTTRSPVAADR